MLPAGELTRMIQSTSHAEHHPKMYQEVTLGLGIDLRKGFGGGILLKSCPSM